MYDDFYSFDEGLSLVKLNGKRGFVDTNGVEVIALKYDDAFSFDNGLAQVKSRLASGDLLITAEKLLLY